MAWSFSGVSTWAQSMRARAGADHSEMRIAQRSLPVLVIKQEDAGEGEIALTRAYFRKAQRRPLDHFGRCSSVTSSSGGGVSIADP